MAFTRYLQLQCQSSIPPEIKVFSGSFYSSPPSGAQIGEQELPIGIGSKYRQKEYARQISATPKISLNRLLQALRQIAKLSDCVDYPCTPLLLTADSYSTAVATLFTVAIYCLMICLSAPWNLPGAEMKPIFFECFGQ